MAAGLQREAQLFGQLAVTDVSRKLVQIFFATTSLKKDFGIADAPAPRRSGASASSGPGSWARGSRARRWSRPAWTSG